jgi:hypothetical protein
MLMKSDPLRNAGTVLCKFALFSRSQIVERQDWQVNLAMLNWSRFVKA